MLKPVAVGDMVEVMEDVGANVVHKLIPLEKATEIVSKAHSVNPCVYGEFTHCIDHKWWMRCTEVGRKPKRV